MSDHGFDGNVSFSALRILMGIPDRAADGPCLRNKLK